MKKIILLFALLFIELQSIHAQVNLTQGLVGYWDFNGNANDVSGNNNNGTVNGATLTADKWGNPNGAYNFNGTSDFIEVPNSQSINFGSSNDSFTIFAIVKPKGYYIGVCHGNCIIDKSTSDFIPGYGIRFLDGPFTGYQNCVNAFVDTAHQNFQLHRSNPTTALVPIHTPYIVSNTWYCITAVNTANSVKFYVNGALVYTTAGDGNLANSPSNLFFGKKNWSAYPFYYKGDIDEIRMYNRTLNIQEIDSLCNFKEFPEAINTYSKNNIELKLYPNPVEYSEISFSNNMLSGKLKYIISTFDGRKILGDEIIDDANHLYKINVKNLSKGNYILEVEQKGKKAVEKFLIK